MKQYVRNYELIELIPQQPFSFYGGGVAYKELIFNILDNEKNIKVLDIGFGIGHLGSVIRSNTATSHWIVDGIDGHEIACYNKDLFDTYVYRNIFHGMAQELTVDCIRDYDIVCILDVIEHMDIADARNTLFNLFSSLKEGGYIFLSTPLFFMPQACIEKGDLEQHKIGVPVSSLINLKPLMYSIYSHDILVGGFVYGKDSLSAIDQFKPTTDISFNVDAGYAVALTNDVIIHNDVIVFMP
jgi:hypothetical protein